MEDVCLPALARASTQRAVAMKIGAVCFSSSTSPVPQSRRLLGNPVLRAALTSGAFCALGDTAAQMLRLPRKVVIYVLSIRARSTRSQSSCLGLQALIQQLFLLQNRERSAEASTLDVRRLARMGTFGLCFYGPAQHYWSEMTE